MNNVTNSQMTNFKTYLLYKEICTSLASNVFKYKNLPKTVNKQLLNDTLLEDGSIAFFNDELIGLLALPYATRRMNIYNEPLEIDVIMPNGYVRTLNENEFVILWDNNRHTSIYKYVLQFSERLASCTRTSDINIDQQKTPRFFQVPQEKEVSFKNLINDIDKNVNAVATYDNLEIEESTCVLKPAPFVADKIDEHKDKIWQEFLTFIGITSTNVEKKERLIKDEIKASLGGNYAGRFNRFESRKDGIEEINNKFNNLLEKNIIVEYYDEIPSSKEDKENAI